MQAHALLLLRHAILLQLAAASPLSLPLQTIQEGLRLAGQPTQENDLLQQLSHLEDKGFITASGATLATAHRRYRLNAGGRDYLESEGLI